MAAFADRGRQPAARRSALLPRRARDADRALDEPERGVPADCARSRARSCPASARRRRRSTPSFPWIAQTRALRVAGRARRACVNDLRPTIGDLAQRHRRRRSSCSRRSTCVASCFTDVILPTGDIVIERRRPRRPASRTTRSSGTAGRALRRVAELRRQRPATRASRPAAATQTVSTGKRAAGDDRRARCSATRSASRSARGPARPAEGAAVQPRRRRLLQEPDARTSTAPRAARPTG